MRSVPGGPARRVPEGLGAGGVAQVSMFGEKFAKVSCERALVELIGNQLMEKNLLDDMKAVFEERNKAFEENDLKWAERQLPEGTEWGVIKAAFHKARYECTAVSDVKRLESQQWLAERGIARMGRVAGCDRRSPPRRRLASEAAPGSTLMGLRVELLVQRCQPGVIGLLAGQHIRLHRLILDRSDLGFDALRLA